MNLSHFNNIDLPMVYDNYKHQNPIKITSSSESRKLKRGNQSTMTFAKQQSNYLETSDELKSRKSSRQCKSVSSLKVTLKQTKEVPPKSVSPFSSSKTVIRKQVFSPQNKKKGKHSK